MAFDGVFLWLTTKELKEAENCHIDKIYQPFKDEIILHLRKKDFSKKLLISVKSGAARIHFTQNKYENPPVPTNFCMLLRKYLSSSRLISVSQYNLDRILELKFSNLNELGDIVEISLICEFISNQANIILIKDGKILDALRRSDIENAKRLIISGASYVYPQSPKKINPIHTSLDSLKELNFSENISKDILNFFDGFSPLISREIEFLSQIGNETIQNTLKKHLELIKTNSAPYILLDLNGNPLDFSYREIKQYGEHYRNRKFDSFSSLLDYFYYEKDHLSKIRNLSSDIIKLVNNLKKRTEKKLSIRINELKNCENRETYRIYGELLKANLHLINNGDCFATVQNYYEPDMKEVKIPLNPALSPVKNAEKYFKDYKKSYTASQSLTVLIEKDKEELAYLDSVLDSISRLSSLGEINEIRQELTLSGYIKNPVQKKNAKQKPLEFLEYTSKEGYKIIVGKNNLQNDYLTTKLGNKNDMWFHTKGIAGSHTVVFCDGKPLSDETILQAALLAAKNSKAKDSSSVAVDYTPIKYVKKPNGAKPGMVIYTTNKTVYVTPER